jgi:hypothetical protein
MTIDTIFLIEIHDLDVVLRRRSSKPTDAKFAPIADNAAVAL